MTGLILFAAAFVIMQIHVLTMAMIGSILGAKIEDFGISFGPTLFQFKVGSVNLKFNAIPLGGYVKFSDDFERLAWWKRIVTALSGCLMLVLISFALLGFDLGFRHFINGFGQILWGALMPFSAGKSLVAALVDFAHHNSFTAYLGLFASKLAALNLLPLGSLNGGAILTVALKALMPSAEKMIENYQLIAISWLIALVSFLLS